jgi:hypothetical protein
MRRMRRIELQRIAELERKIPHRACRRYVAMLAEVKEALQIALPNESLTVFEATQRYQRMLKSGTAR